MSEPLDPHDEGTVLESLGRRLPRVAPPADLFDRILAAVAHAPETEPALEAAPAVVPTAAAEQPPAPLPRRPRRWLPVLAAGLASAAAAVLVTVALEGGGGLGVVSARATVVGLAPSVRLSGTAELYRPLSPAVRCGLRSDTCLHPRQAATTSSGCCRTARPDDGGRLLHPGR